MTRVPSEAEIVAKNVLNGKAAWSWRVVEVLMALIVALLTSYAFLDARMDSLLANIGPLSERISIIEANRYTAADALQHRELHAHEQVALAERLPSEFPPRWVLDLIDNHITDPTIHHRRFEKIEDRITALERTE